MGIDWRDRPGGQRSKGSGLKLIRATRYKQLVRLLGPAVRVMTHWAAMPDGHGKLIGRTHPCLGAECLRCPDPDGLREKGYVPAIHNVADQAADSCRRMLGILELTEAALDALDELTADEPARWRGLLLEIVRTGGASNGAVQVRLRDQAPTYDLPPAFDVRPALLHLWRIDEPPPLDERPSDDDTIPFDRRKAN